MKDQFIARIKQIDIEIAKLQEEKEVLSKLVSGETRVVLRSKPIKHK